jgi:hypothetical protein
MSAAAVVLGIVPMDERTQVRVLQTTHKGIPVVDVRLWWLPAGQDEFLPTRKGIQIDPNLAHQLRAALELVK